MNKIYKISIANFSSYFRLPDQSNFLVWAFCDLKNKYVQQYLVCKKSKVAFKNWFPLHHFYWTKNSKKKLFILPSPKNVCFRMTLIKTNDNDKCCLSYWICIVVFPIFNNNSSSKNLYYIRWVVPLQLSKEKEKKVESIWNVCVFGSEGVFCVYTT